MSTFVLYAFGFLALFTLGTQGASCPTMQVSGANKAILNGNYDRHDDYGCHGRDIYRKGSGNSSDIYWIYFYKYSAISRGWLLGTNPCSNDRAFGELKVWNVNQRPDRVLIGWEEREDDDVFRKNRNISVVCSEGLTYPQIVGIIVGCIFGVALIAGLVAFFVVRAGR